MKEKVVKHHLKTTEVLLGPDGLELTDFDICKGTGVTNCFKSHTNSWCPHFFQEKVFLMFGLKFTLSDVTSFLPDNLPGLKKNYAQAWGNQSHKFSGNKQMQMMFTTEEFLEVAIGYRKLVWVGCEPTTTEYIYIL